MLRENSKRTYCETYILTVIALRLTGSDLNKPVMVTVVPRCASISTWIGQGKYGEGHEPDEQPSRYCW